MMNAEFATEGLNAYKQCLELMENKEQFLSDCKALKEIVDCLNTAMEETDDDKKSTSPQTGDAAPVAALVLLVSAATVVFAAKKR